MRYRLFGLAALAGSAALIASSPAWAHARLVSSTPAAGATLTASPKAITLTFNEKLAPAFSKFELTRPDRNGMALPVRTTVSKDGKSITGTPDSPLPKGAYKIVWTAASADGHRMSGQLAFKVG